MRLWIEYLLIAVIIGVGSLAINTKMTTLRQQNTITTLASDLHSAEDKIEIIQGVNKSQGDVIVKLSEDRAVDGQMIVELMDTYQNLALKDNELRQRLRDLEKLDETARNYLAAPVPDAIACVYDDSCTAAEANSSGGVSGDSSYPEPGSAKNLLLAPETETSK